MMAACVIVCLIALSYNVIDLIDTHIDKKSPPKSPKRDRR